MTTTDDRYDRVIALIREGVADLNEAIGLDREPAYDEPRVSFGYIGNGRRTSSGWDLSGTIYYVFLPTNPGVGAAYVPADDRIGDGFVYGDLVGAGMTLAALRGAVKGARLLSSMVVGL